MNLQYYMSPNNNKQIVSHIDSSKYKKVLVLALLFALRISSSKSKPHCHVYYCFHQYYPTVFYCFLNEPDYCQIEQREATSALNCI